MPPQEASSRHQYSDEHKDAETRSFDVYTLAPLKPENIVARIMVFVM